MGRIYHRWGDAGRRVFVIHFIFLVVITGFLASCATFDAGSTPVAILVSDRLAAYQQVADALRARLPRARIYELDGDPRRARAVMARLRAGEAVAVVAVGSLATRVAIKASERPIVFCQDFNPEDIRAARVAVRGVRAMPAALKQLQAWKTLDPRLKRVTMISGAGMGEFAREAAAGARQLGISLQHVEVQSDRELLYAAKRTDADVQGLWFTPDNRVLSTEVLREVLAYNVRQGKQTLVFSARLLGLGALLSVEGDPHDVAARVIEQLHPAGGAPVLAPLQRARASINIEVAKQLGLVVPPPMQAGTYVF